MIAKVLVGVILALLIGLGGLSWWLTETIKERGALQERVALYQKQLAMAVAINQGLHKKILQIQKRNKLLQVKVDVVEATKTDLRKQLERKNNALKSILRAEKPWADTPIPPAVAASVNNMLKRLQLDSDHDGNRG